MSMMPCDYCDKMIDTDRDPESLYVEDRDCLCVHCRHLLGEPSEFEDDN